MVVAAAKVGVLKRPESEGVGVGVVICVEAVREDEKTEASTVSESLSWGREFVEEVEEDGRDCSVDTVGENMELSVESGVWNSSSEVASLPVSSARGGGGSVRDSSSGKLVWIGRGRGDAREGFGCNVQGVRYFSKERRMKEDDLLWGHPGSLS